MGINISEIPGLAEEVAKEAKRVEYLREIAFLDIPLEMCGIEVEQFKPRHWQRLSIAGNPFVCGGTISAEAILQFFWVISPRFSTDPREAQKFAEETAAILPESDKCAEEIQRYLDDSFMDRRASAVSHSTPLPNCGPTSSVIHDMAPHGRPMSEVLGTPFGALFQLIRHLDIDAYQVAGMRPPPAFNPADKVRARIIRLYQEGKWPPQ
jgi:hypothetical protein